MILKKPLRHFVVLSVSLSGVWLIDQFITRISGDYTLSPLLSIMCLGILASIFSCRQVLLATPCFAFLSYFLILETAKFPVVRSTSVLIAGGLAAWAAAQRVRIVKHSQEVETILQALPVPWILSDESGNVTRMSEKARLLAAPNQESVVGSSYFSLLTPVEGKGVYIRRYLDAFTSIPTPLKTKVFFTASPDSAWSATFFALDFAEGKRLLTVFEK